ncbi:MAG: TonB-dependent receptor [Pseudomonadales bacterium]|nr:TonB-dependent receptor [Pseudomonadales bacterium]
MKKTHIPARKKLALVVSAITSGLILAGSGTVNAQSTDQGSSLEEIRVTGSRIVRRDLSAPSPIMTVGSQQFEDSSTFSPESILNQFPQFVPENTQFTTGDIEAGATSSPGVATLNLRGLGSNRNLILIDGRRGQPANATLAVDVNTIPTAAIANVEVITGGASSTYGADAMAGVVNFILKDNFEGLDMDLQSSMTEQGDGQETRFSALFGVNSADGRGNIMLGFEIADREGVKSLNRKFNRAGFTDPGTDTGSFIMPTAFNGGGVASNQPTQAAVDALFPEVAPGTVGTSSEFLFNPDGSAFVAQRGIGFNGPLGQLDGQGGAFENIRVNANGNLDQPFTEGLISSPLDRRSFFGRAHYDIADNISAFAQVSYSRTQVSQVGAPPPAITVWGATIPRDGRELPADLNALLDSRPDPSADWTLFRVLDFLGPVSPENTTNVYQITAGFEGTLPIKDWTWEAYVSTGETRQVNETFNLGSLQRWQFLVASENFGKGSFTQGRNFTQTCSTGLPIFEQFTPSQDCLDAIEAPQKVITDLKQDIAEFNLQGALMDLPAGEARFAFGGHWRQNTFRFEPGLINNNESVIENPIGLFASNDTDGDTITRELYGELLVPLYEGLDLEAGYRFSDYSTAGTVSTYKTLLNWEMNDTITVRGGYQFASRAPNTAELFTGSTLAVVGFPNVDPCSAVTLSPFGNVPSNPRRLEVQALCRALIGNSTSQFDTQTFNTPNGPDGFTRQNPPFFPLEIEIRKGNPNLDVEEGKTFTIGFVLQEPLGISGLTASFDWYNINITDAIAPISAVTVSDNCFNADGMSNPTLDVNNPWCQMIRRNAITGDRQEIDAPFSNLGKLETAGLDIQINWAKEMGPGTFTLSSTINYLNKFKTQDTQDAPVLDSAGTLDDGGQFDYRVFTRFGYIWDNANVALTWRHLPDADDAASVLNPNTTLLGVNTYDIFNLSGGYNFGSYQLRVGIDNVLDTQPEVVGRNPGVDNNRGTTSGGFYDQLGRRYYMGLKASF